MRKRSENFQDLPLEIVGSTKFGRYTKISSEQTFNMIISDGFLVPYAGYENACNGQSFGDVGRGIYTSNIHNILIVVIDDGLYIGEGVSSNQVVLTKVGTLNTDFGIVYIDENTNNQIAISDSQYLYIYDPVTGDFTILTPTQLGFTPGYITYQDTRFIAPSVGTAAWWLSAESQATTIPWPYTGSIQTKPDNAVATLRFPGRGNNLLVFGSNVTEIWSDIGQVLFPYQRNSSQNIDYGCVNAATIAYNTNRVVWLAQNEKSGPTIMYTDGNDPQKISTDGIDYKLATLTNPSNSFGFLFRQDGHDIYQITFPDDNVTYAYDFNTNMFFTITDPNQNYHIATRVAFFNDNYYFVSNTNGNVYRMSSSIYTAAGEDIPRIRITKNIRFPDNSRFAANNASFLIESGINDTNDTSDPLPQRVILTTSLNGGYSYGNGYIKDLPTQGKYKNRLIFWRLGTTNDMVLQFRFYGMDRFLASNGIVSIYQ